MTVAAIGIGSQLAAWKRGRGALSAAKRASAPGAWWAGALFKGAATLLLVALASAGGLLVHDRMEVDGETWPAVAHEVLYVPVIFWGWLLFSLLGADPLARGLGFAALSRRRAAWLLVLDGLFSRATALLVTLGLIPWLVLAMLGWTPLSVAGWVGLTLLLLAMAAWRVFVRALYVNAMVIGGRRRAVAAVAMFLFAGAGIATSEQSLRLISGRAAGRDVAALLERPSLILGLGAIVALCMLAAVAIYAARMPTFDALMERLLGRLRSVSRWSPGPARVYHPSAVVAGARVQALRVARDPATWMATVWLIGTRVSETLTGAPAALEFVALVTATGGFYNLYGDQAPYYAAWLASGSSLGAWTRSLLVVQVARCVLVLALGSVVLLAPPAADPSRAESFAWMMVTATAVGSLAGPVVSLRWPVATRGHRGPVHLGAAVFVSWGGSVGVGVLFLALRGMVAAGSTGWLVPACLVVVSLVAWRTGPGQAAWSSRRRDRFHRAFAHCARG